MSPVSQADRPEGEGLRGHLRFEAKVGPAGDTQIGAQSFRAPFHLGKGYWDGRVLQVRVVNATAGILSGDSLELDITANAGTALAVVLPAATRVFMMRSGAATCRQRFAVRSGAWLEYAPEPLFPHAGATYTQSTMLELAEGAEAFWVDSLAPGRAGRGECWAWARLRLGLEIIHGGRPLLKEQLDASGEALARQAAFHRTPEAWFATVVIASPRLPPSGDLWPQVRSLHGAACRAAPTQLAPAVWIVRLIATSSLALRDTLSTLRCLTGNHLPRLTADLRRGGLPGAASDVSSSTPIKSEAPP